MHGFQCGDLGGQALKVTEAENARRFAEAYLAKGLAEAKVEKSKEARRIKKNGAKKKQRFGPLSSIEIEIKNFNQESPPQNGGFFKLFAQKLVFFHDVAIRHG